MIDDLTAGEVRGRLKLEPHATCGFVRVTFISEKRLAKYRDVADDLRAFQQRRGD